MPNPTYVKNWTYPIVNGEAVASNNRANGSTDGTDERKDVLFQIFRGMIDSPVAGVTVTRSCDSVTAADSDLWTDYTKLRWGTSLSATRSWICLTFANLSSSGPVHFLFDLLQPNGSYGNRIEVWCSSTSAFTGGSPTQRPAAPDEVLLKSFPQTGFGTFRGNWDGGENTTGVNNFRFSQMISDDGKHFRTLIFSGGQIRSVFMIEALYQPQALTHDFLFCFVGLNEDMELLFKSGNHLFLDENKARQSGNFATLGFGSVLAYDAVANKRRSDGTIAVFPVFFFGQSNSAEYRWGDLVDLYVGGNEGNTLTHMPNDALREWVKIEFLLFPWNNNDFLEIN